jgi:hypothetical protein
MKKEIVDVKGDGNCFYRAIYGYVLHNNVMSSEEFFNIFECKELARLDVSSVRSHFASDDPRQRLYNTEQEDKFDTCVRNYLSAFVLQYPSILQDNLNLLQQLDDQEYETMKTYYTEWFGKAFPKPPKDVKSYARAFSDNVKISTTYACDVDFIVIHKVLEHFGYQLGITFANGSDTVNYIKAIAMLPDVPRSDTIYLVKIAEHYNFVKFSQENPQTSSRGMLVGGKKKKQIRKKIMVNSKLYTKYYSKQNGKSYIIQNKKKIFV